VIYLYLFGGVEQVGYGIIFTNLEYIPEGDAEAMADPFELNPDETIIYRCQPSRQWYMLVGRIGIGILEVLLFMLLSFISLTSLVRGLLAIFLLPDLADGLSRVIFQGLVPLAITAWFVEDTARIFTSELILTSRRLWTTGSPYAWTSGRETSLDDIQSISARRDAVFIHLKNTKRVQIHAFPNGRQIVQAYTQLTGKSGS